MLSSINILGVKVTNEREDKVLEYVVERIKKGGKKLFITTPNPEILTYAYSHLDYLNKLNSAEVSLPDGVGLKFAAQIMGKPLKSRIAGTDFMEKLCLAAKENPMSMGFLGGKRRIAERTAERLKSKYPWLNVVLVETEPYKLLKSPKLLIDLLFVALGAPKQEEWIYANLQKLPVKAAMGVGGAFDYISGTVPRAPLFIRKAGLEWLFRLTIQPWRWRRQLALIKFVYLVFKDKLRD